MNGLAAFIFGVGVVLWLVLAYAGGLPGCIGGAVVVVSAWLIMGLARWSDVSLVVVEALTGTLILWVTTRWALRHRGWLKRLEERRRQIMEERRLLENGVLHLREVLASRDVDVERYAEQYELVKRLSQARRLESILSILDSLVKHLFQTQGGWDLYLADGRGTLRRVDDQEPLLEPTGDFPSKEPALHPLGDSWLLRVPLWRLHERVGLLHVTLSNVSPDERAGLLAKASELGTQLIFPMARARLHLELDRVSRADALTGFYRRRPFEERLRQEVARAQAFSSTFSILRLEIIPMYPVWQKSNAGQCGSLQLMDSSEGAVQEEILRGVGQCLQESLYETDVIARLEGANFVCILPQAIPDGLKRKAEDLRQRIESQAYVIGLEAVRVIFRMGVAHFPQDGASTEAITAAAERALKAAKNASHSGVVEASTISQ